MQQLLVSHTLLTHQGNDLMQFPICPKPEMREYEAKERGGTQSDTLGHKVQKGNVKWLLKYTKFGTSNSNPNFQTNKTHVI